MSGSGAPEPNRFVTFYEVYLSQSFSPVGPPDRDDGFVSYDLASGEDFGSISITRSDGKVLSFDVNRSDGVPVVEIGRNVIRWSAYSEFHADGPFQ